VVRPRTVTAAGGTGEAALAVQRDARGRTRSSSAPPAPSAGAPAKDVPAPGRKRSSSAAPAAPAATASATSAASATASGRNAARRTETPQDDPGLDLDDLARRLLDPVARLLRTELRRGRDRTGRPYDGRR
jgi:syndecan 1